MSFRFKELFPRKSVIGMIHLAGRNGDSRINRALRELEIYDSAGIHGAIIEDYHGFPRDVIRLIHAVSDRNYSFRLGINLLRDPYQGFELAGEHGLRFVQFDNVQRGALDKGRFKSIRNRHPEVLVLGGVRFKYTSPSQYDLGTDLDFAKGLCDAIVTTGEGTGIETPIEKLRDFRQRLNGFPLVSGAGVNCDNLNEQFSAVDAVIIGSYFKKDNQTRNELDWMKVKQISDLVKRING